MKNVFFILLFFAQVSFAQDSTIKQKQWEWNGYVKDLQSFNFDKDYKNLVSGNLIHNRINIKWKPTEQFTAAAEFRNRLFWGEEVSIIPRFASQLSNENETLNLSAVWISQQNFVLHSNTERLWLEYRKPRWNVRLGRQRINWGITTTWNPNDIFNTYNFLDVDFEERPGIDAGKVQYQLSDFSHVETAVYPGNNKVKATAAVKYFINKNGYDLQLLTGIYQQKFTIGAGWAGSIKDAGFKGEVQYFAPASDSSGQLNISLESDYIFKSGLYVNIGILYNKEGISKKINDWENLNFTFSPVNLMPTKYTLIIGAAKEVTPLFSGNIAILFAPGTNLFLLLPSLKYSIGTNFYADWVWQSFFTEIDKKFQAVNHRSFIRLKWNF